MLLQHGQSGYGGEDNLGMHAAIDSGWVLKDRSGETASTPQIVTIRPASAGGPAEKRRAAFRRPERES